MIRDFGAYLRERFRLSIFGPAIALHVTGALWANGAAPEPAAILYCAGLATLLLLQFRLWDDLEDRERDRAAHPDRVLVCASPSPFRRLLAALCLVNVALMAATGSRSAPGGLALLNLAFWLAYRRMRPRLPDFVWRFQVLLFKYPAFVGLLAAAIGTPLSGRSIAAALAVYATACAYEVLHDRRIQIGAIS
jgi:hypothetical protein